LTTIVTNNNILVFKITHYVSSGTTNSNNSNSLTTLTGVVSLSVAHSYSEGITMITRSISAHGDKYAPHKKWHVPKKI